MMKRVENYILKHHYPTLNASALKTISGFFKSMLIEASMTHFPSEKKLKSRNKSIEKMLNELIFLFLLN